MCSTSQCELRSTFPNLRVTNVIHIVTYYTLPRIESPTSSWMTRSQRSRRRDKGLWLVEASETTSLRRRINCDVAAYVTQSAHAVWADSSERAFDRHFLRPWLPRYFIFHDIRSLKLCLSVLRTVVYPETTQRNGNALRFTGKLFFVLLSFSYRVRV